MQQMPNIWETCKFSDDIVAGVPDYSKFAVELHSVLDGTADEIYKDPSQFLENTYLTQRMEVFLKDVFLRVKRNERQPVMLLIPNLVEAKRIHFFSYIMFSTIKASATTT